MATDIKEVKLGEKIRPNSFRTTFEGETFKLEFGEYVEKDQLINILSEIEMSDDDIIMFIKGLLYSIVEYQQNTNINMAERLNKALMQDEQVGDSNGK